MVTTVVPSYIVDPFRSMFDWAASVFPSQDSEKETGERTSPSISISKISSLSISFSRNLKSSRMFLTTESQDPIARIDTQLRSSHDINHQQKGHRVPSSSDKPRPSPPPAMLDRGRASMTSFDKRYGNRNILQSQKGRESEGSPPCEKTRTRFPHDSNDKGTGPWVWVWLSMNLAELLVQHQKPNERRTGSQMSDLRQGGMKPVPSSARRTAGERDGISKLID
ncbi:hypothetical protein B0T20DRAFT_148469 [Sordaria brevicollis]|uniref:Uncharacterized protein n=1 Tax=Sordaria brevicollis TaxID=83679 RepID=A0AAE0PIA4_SORBR|nr:hypothetical protein B0T20DRAFT_148469 [Sordaria brevicollis]